LQIFDNLESIEPKISVYLSHDKKSGFRHTRAKALGIAFNHPLGVVYHTGRGGGVLSRKHGSHFRLSGISMTPHFLFLVHQWPLFLGWFWYINGSFFKNLPILCKILKKNLTFSENFENLSAFSGQNFGFWYIYGSNFQENWYLHG